MTCTPACCRWVPHDEHADDLCKVRGWDKLRTHAPSSTFAGCVYLYQDDPTKKFYIPIYAANDATHFRETSLSRHPETTIPDAMTVRTVDGSLMIYINTLLWDWLLAEEGDHRRSIADGIIAHEVGHYLAGYLVSGKNSKAILDNITSDELTRLDELSGKGYDDYLYNLIAEGLMKGAVFGIEWEADIQAMRVCDPVDIIHVHLLGAEFHTQIGCRFEKMNRVLRHWKNLIQDRYDRLEKVECEFVIYTPNQVESINHSLD